MVDRQRAAPHKCIGSHSLAGTEGDAGRGLTASIVDRVRELDSATGAIGRDMNGGSIGNDYRSTAGHS